MRWTRDVNGLRMKAEFYPDMEKRDLLKEGATSPGSPVTAGAARLM
ncbi:MAG TPA: hypothetical protein PLD30_08240 [Candidatus Competibacteraceae bacterium]|nr:hypothetical protein [Candidatus Competibacteraceae bacterium]